MANTDRHFDNLDPTALHPSRLLFEHGRSLCVALIILGALGSGLGWIMNEQEFYFSWLSSWTYLWTMLMGVLFFVMLHYLVGAGWDTVVRRPAEQLLSTMPVFAAGLIPIVIGLLRGKVYGWVHPDHPLEGFKGVFLSVPVVLTCLVIYAGIWLWLAHVMRRNSIRQDADGAAHWTRSSNRWAAGGILLYGLSLTGCALHLLQSLDYHWFSTMWGVYTWAGGVVGGLAIVSLLSIKLRRGPLRQYIGSDTIHDLGKLFFAFCCFWAYIAFSQYFLIWYGNIPEETMWFLRRWNGEAVPGSASWWPLALLFPLGLFVIPFFTLMSAHMKRNMKVLGTVCAIALVAHWIEVYWMVHPETRTAVGHELHLETPNAVGHQLVHLAPPLQWAWIDLSVIALLVGVAGMIYIAKLRKAALFPVMDPHLVEALSAEHVEEIEHADQD